MPELPPRPLLDRVTIRSAADIRPAAEALHALALSLARLRTAACANIASKEPMVDASGALLATEVFGWTGAGLHWWENPRLALTSPLTTACRYESEPFWCNKDGVHTRGQNPLLEELDLDDFFRRAMTEAAIAVPVHLPFGQIGVVSFSPEKPGRTDLSAEFEAHADVLELHARKFICGYVKVMNRQRSIQPDVRLSKREVECLRWAAAGKTDAEIGRILTISPRTTRFHIENAKKKLGVATRIQAVTEALRLRAIAA